MERSVAIKASLPTGMVTFLFSDIEGSTQRWERPSRRNAPLALAIPKPSDD
jgi:class 3 adenylate cyclase